MTTELPYPTLAKQLPYREAICRKCSKTKYPSRAYLALLKSRDLPYVCKACREAGPPQPMDLGKLGVL